MRNVADCCSNSNPAKALAYRQAYEAPAGDCGATVLSAANANRTEELLEQILRILAATAVSGKGLSEGAPLLDRLGVDRALTASIYNTTEAAVRATVSRAGRSPKKSGK